jgi:hypothetical protein
MKKLLALALLLCFTTAFAQNKQESLKINWPEEYKWKVGSDQESGQTHLIELVPGRETVEKWTLMGTMMSVKGVKVATTAQMAEIFRQSSLKESPDSKLTILESDDTAKNIWTLFKVETPKFPNDPVPESQLYYVIQGEGTLYINFIAIKEKTLSKSFIEKWTKVFKAGELVYL